MTLERIWFFILLAFIILMILFCKHVKKGVLAKKLAINKSFFSFKNSLTCFYQKKISEKQKNLRLRFLITLIPNRKFENMDMDVL